MTKYDYLQLRTKKEPIVKRCVICSQEFTTNQPLKRTCSERCAHALKLEAERKYKLSKGIFVKSKHRRECQDCGRYFSITENSPYCDDCLEKYRLAFIEDWKKKNGISRKVEENECRYCGTVLIRIKNHGFHCPKEGCPIFLYRIHRGTLILEVKETCPILKFNNDDEENGEI